MKIKDIGKHKKYHDGRVENNRQVTPPSPIDTDTGFVCLDNARKRMKHTIPGNTLGDSFIQALDTAEGTEYFTVWENGDKDAYKVILKNLKDDWQKDTKYISAMNDLGFQLGNTVTWQRLNIRWLIISQDYNIDEYFRGTIQKATHLLRWKNENGIIKEQWAYVQGPIETRAKYEQTIGNVIVGRQNDTTEILIGANDKKNIKELIRFKKLKIGNRVWTIQVVDDISSEFILRLSCVEDFENEATDNMLEGIPNGLIDFAENEKPTELPSTVRIVGPTKIPEKLISRFYAVDENEEVLVGNWVVENVETYYMSEDNKTLIVKGKKKGDRVKISYSDDSGRENSIEVKTVSMLST